ncbi:IS1595 family transposase [Acidicapsa dinghuensis]|uniref:IS1595 family transposase n=1 Tax=Acidicapsa dinghuensis TaxID=2218256 RepID=A0ABW1EMY5_9BACT|nr:IS1595 family transposase [Acidicapsa dinghuensis]
MKAPQTLQEAIIHFADPDNCIAYMVAHRWPDGVECPICGRKDVGYLANQKKWQCKSGHAKRQFTAKVGTIFEDSPLGLDKWLPAVWLITSAKNGVSSCEIARSLGVTQKTAWFMLHRIRYAMQNNSFVKLGGSGSGGVEVDETFIGGKARNMHKSVKARRITATGPSDKTAVLGILERGGEIRVGVVPSRKKKVLQDEVKKHVEPGTELYTDFLLSYEGLAAEYGHKVVDHAIEYVNGLVHTNGLENFWSLLKRGIGGTYVSVEPFHLFRYLDEQAFRYNNRKDKSDADRFSMVLSRVAGKRLTYAEVTGKVGETAF